jgi:hypothetical protein
MDRFHQPFVTIFELALLFALNPCYYLLGSDRENRSRFSTSYSVNRCVKLSSYQAAMIVKPLCRVLNEEDCHDYDTRLRLPYLPSLYRLTSGRPRGLLPQLPDRRDPPAFGQDSETLRPAGV